MNTENYGQKTPDILKTATDYYRGLYKCKNVDIQSKKFIPADTEIIPTIYLEDTVNAINTHKLNKAPESRYKQTDKEYYNCSLS